MDNFITCKLQGGLGNYLFQIISTFGISKKHNKKFLIDLQDIHSGHNPIYSYIDNIFKNFTFVNIESEYDTIFVNDVIKYTEIPNYSQPVKLNGYLQNEKYFKEYRDEILDLLSIDESTLSKLNLKYPEIRNNRTCSIHVRRGDYIDLQHIHKVQDLSYYNKAISLIGNDYRFLIFSDDIEWCKKNFNHLNDKIFIEGNSDVEDLYLMSMCKHNIISNSTFSWWSAWINKNINKKIIYPSEWFTNNCIDSSEIGCINWLKI